MKTNMKIDVEKSMIYRFDSQEDLSQAVFELGEKGYFSDNEDFSNYSTGTLTRVLCWLEKVEFTFTYRNEKTTDSCRYFISEDHVVFKEEKKKTLRPFKSIDEFFEVTGFKIDDIVQVKNFAGCTFEETSLITGFRVYTDEEYHRMDVIFGGSARPLSELFKHYKYYKNGEWLSFGVEE